MPPQTFQIRHCQNPDCGLRYPLLDRSPFGERCPACLGATVVVEQGALEREQAIEERSNRTEACLHALIDNVRSAWNVGSIFRSAEGFGFEHIYLCGITPSPDNPEVRKTALGAQDIVSWSAHKNAVDLVSGLKHQGFTIWALEHDSYSTPIGAALPELASIKKCVLVVGNEQVGVDPALIRSADRAVHLPMRGQKRSFNVSVAFAVAAHLMRSHAR